MENTIIFEGKELKWKYNICPCLECPIYPTRNEWEEEARKDVRLDKCWTSRCAYDKKKAEEMANSIFFLMNNYHCYECDEWFSKDEIDERVCPNCYSELH